MWYNNYVVRHVRDRSDFVLWISGVLSSIVHCSINKTRWNAICTLNDNCEAFVDRNVVVGDICYSPTRTTRYDIDFPVSSGAEREQLRARKYTADVRV